MFWRAAITDAARIVGRRREHFLVFLRGFSHTR